MADQTISTQTITDFVDRPQPYWMHYGPTFDLINVDVTGTLSGTVKEAGVLQANAIVSVYYRPNGKLIARVRTDASGAWSVPNLDKSVADYYAVAQTESNYNAIIYDKLTPV